MSKQAFSSFTRKYALSKTLRFELKPYNEHVINYLKANQVLEKDEDIEKSYQILKLIMDKIHERFINESLESESTKEISFLEYIEIYKAEKKEGKLRKDEETKKILAGLRGSFGKCFEEVSENWQKQIGKDEKGKEVFKKKSYEMLTEEGILQHIKHNIQEFADKNTTEEEIKWALSKFERFFTYFSGFNQNRENYYETKDEKSTAIATRVIHVNLPKFCDNIIAFEKRKDEYLKVYNTLDKTKQIKDAQSGKMIDIYPIDEKYFRDAYFNSCLSQKEIEEYNRIIGHYNSIINLYNQQQTEKGKKLSLFKTLYKQIGCGKKKAFIFQITHDFETETENKRQSIPEAISVQEVLKLVEQSGEKYFRENKDNLEYSVISFITDLRNRTDWTGYYWSKAAFNTLSNWYFANWQDLAVKLIKNKENPNGIFEKTEKKKELETGEKVKIPDTISLEKLFLHIDKSFPNWKEGFFKERILEKRVWEDEKDKIDTEKKKIFDTAKSPSEVLIKLLCLDIEREILAWEKEKNEVLSITNFKSEKSKELMKTWLDYTVNIFRMVKYFSVPEGKIKDGGHLDATLAEILKALLEPEDAQWFKWYDGLRNYLTKKVGEEEKENKLKLNFDSGALLQGWSDGQEKQKKAVILNKEGKYYLGILNKTSLFDTEKENNHLYSEKETGSGRLILANLKFQTLAGKGYLGEFKESYGTTGKRNPLDAIKNLQKIINDRYIKKYPLLKKIAEETYTDKTIFDKDINETLPNCYVCGFKHLNWEKIEESIEKGDLYVFEIYDKDLKKENNIGKNLQTIYWEHIFEQNSLIQLCGGAEVFFRNIAIQEKDKKIKDGYESKQYIIEKKRYTSTKILFHCPIKINYKSKDYSKPEYALGEFNWYMNEYITRSSEMTYLGLDRGEKHLVYFSLVDKEGNIVKQGSFNEINGKNYLEKLEEIAGERDEARKNWQKIGSIKEIKDGYISQIVHEVIKLALENNALIVMEDLNTGFKRGRQKIEKSIYQKFELALAKKLNFIVDKSKSLGEIGSVTNALQLTPPVQNYGDIEGKKQVGIMLYTRANYTSQTDPKTGWRKSIYLKKGSEENIKEQIIKEFKDIGFDGKDYYFDYKDPQTQKIRRLYSSQNSKSLERYRGQKNAQGKYVIEKVDINEILDGVFKNFDKCSSEKSLLTQIIDDNLKLEKISSEHTAWESLRYAVELIQQIRNTGKEGDVRNSDFLLSPVRDDSGKHYDSRDYWDEIGGAETVPNPTKKPVSGDANGAYNIARKGILMAEHIKVNSDSKDISLFITDEEWSMYLTDKNKWKAELPRYSSKKAMEKKI